MEDDPFTDETQRETKKQCSPTTEGLGRDRGPRRTQRRESRTVRAEEPLHLVGLRDNDPTPARVPGSFVKSSSTETTPNEIVPTIPSLLPPIMLVGY